jgi:hypothetical protein
LLGIRSRLFGRDRLRRYRHNVRTVGVWRAVTAELRNLFHRGAAYADGAPPWAEPSAAGKNLWRSSPGV